MYSKRDKILFVGSFKDAAKDGSVGGQMFACKTLINSGLKEEFEFILIDSTADSVPAPPVYKRIGKVFIRFIKLIYHLIKDKPSKVLLFSSAGLSLIEKGLMALVSKIFFVKVIFAPRSGLIKSNANSSAFYRYYIKLVLKISDVVICQGSFWKDFYSGFGDEFKNKLIVIPNWIDTLIYTNNRPEYKNQIALAKEMVYIGWIEDYKGIFDLINAIQLIKSEIEGLNVSIYGSGKKLEEAKELSKKLELEKIITFRGWANLSTKLHVLSEADMYVLPSHAEGLPNALIEAMASGIPSIATRVGGIPDLIINNETGLLIDAHSEDQLAAAILSLYKDPKLREKLSSNGRSHVETNNSLNAMYANMKIILKD